jgi:pyridoxine kinase
MDIARHWKKENIKIDAFFCGFLGSHEQISIVKSIFHMFRTPDMLIMVDPVLGDNGELYRLFTPDHVKSMAQLCGYADLIVPNRTEASFILDIEYKDKPMSKSEVDDILYALVNLGSKQVVLTGVQFSDNDMGAACYDANTGQIDYVMSDRIEGIYYGTGDVFGSFLIGALMREKCLPEAVRIAVEYTWSAIKITSAQGTNPRMGIRFESVLADYCKSLNL